MFVRDDVAIRREDDAGPAGNAGRRSLFKEEESGRYGGSYLALDLDYGIVGFFDRFGIIGLFDIGVFDLVDYDVSL